MKWQGKACNSGISRMFIKKILDNFSGNPEYILFVGNSTRMILEMIKLWFIYFIFIISTLKFKQWFIFRICSLWVSSAWKIQLPLCTIHYIFFLSTKKDFIIIQSDRPDASCLYFYLYHCFLTSVYKKKNMGLPGETKLNTIPYHRTY